MIRTSEEIEEDDHDEERALCAVIRTSEEVKEDDHDEERALCAAIRTSEEVKEDDHDDGVAEVEEGAGEVGQLQLRHVVLDAVGEEEDGREATGEE